MDKLNVLGNGVALAMTLALLNTVCAVVIDLWPEQAVAFANAWMHGLDLAPLISDSPLRLVRFAYGLVGLSAIGFVIGAVYAWLYNQVRAIGRRDG